MSDSIRDESIRAAEKKLGPTYDQLILKYLDVSTCSDVLMHLGLPLEFHEEIVHAAASSGGKQEMVTKLLRRMKEYFRDTWLDEFKEALKKANSKCLLYQHLSIDLNDVLEKVDSDQGHFERLLEIYFSVLAAATPDEVLDILFQREDITLTDVQEVRSIIRHKGEVRGMQALLLRLRYRSRDCTLVALMRALKMTEHHTILNDINQKISEADSSVSIRNAILSTEIDKKDQATRRRSSSAETSANASKVRTKNNLTPPGKQSGNVRTQREQQQTDTIQQQLNDGASVIDLKSTAPASGKVGTTAAAAANNCTTSGYGSYTFSESASVNQLSMTVKDRLYDKSVDSSMTTANITFNRSDSDDNKELANNVQDEEGYQLDEDDVFASLITSVMSEIEEHIKTSPDIEAAKEDVRDLSKLVEITAPRCTNDYTRCADKLLHESAKINNQNFRHFFKTTAHHLLVYNNALMIRAACHASDALSYIQEQLTELAKNQSIPNNETSRWLGSRYNNMVGELDAVSRSPQGFNRNLERLTKLILAAMNNGGDAAAVGVVLCPSSEVATCVATCMRQTASLTSFNPVNIGAAEKSSQRAVSLRRGQLTDIKERVRSNVRLIVTTSGVAKQHDMKSCNFVVKYSGRSLSLNHRTGHGDNGATASTAEQSNQDDFLLKCVKCNALAVFNSSLRRIAKVHHVTVDTSFQDRAAFESHPNPKKSGKWEKTHKIACKGCHQEWGVKATYSVDGLAYNVLTVQSFVIEDRRRQQRKCQKWNEVPFPVQELN